MVLLWHCYCLRLVQKLLLVPTFNCGRCETSLDLDFRTGVGQCPVIGDESLGNVSRAFSLLDTGLVADSKGVLPISANELANRQLVLCQNPIPPLYPLPLPLLQALHLHSFPYSIEARLKKIHFHYFSINIIANLPVRA